MFAVFVCLCSVCACVCVCVCVCVYVCFCEFLLMSLFVCFLFFFLQSQLWPMYTTYRSCLMSLRQRDVWTTPNSFALWTQIGTGNKHTDKHTDRHKQTHRYTNTQTTTNLNRHEINIQTPTILSLFAWLHVHVCLFNDLCVCVCLCLCVSIHVQEGMDVAGGPLGTIRVPPPFGVYVRYITCCVLVVRLFASFLSLSVGCYVLISCIICVCVCLFVCRVTWSTGARKSLTRLLTSMTDTAVVSTLRPARVYIYFAVVVVIVVVVVVVVVVTVVVCASYCLLP